MNKAKLIHEEQEMSENWNSSFSIPIAYKYMFDDCKVLCNRLGHKPPTITDLIKNSLEIIYKELKNEDDNS